MKDNTEVNPRIVYILGLGHSGSTFLEHLLAGRKTALGLGEVGKLTNVDAWNKDLPVCSCGAEARACEIWLSMKPHSGEVDSEWYSRLVKQIKTVCPEKSILIDSTKRPVGILPWLRLKEKGDVADVKVIFLVRDVRGWMISDRNNRARKKRQNRSFGVSMLSWWRSHNRFIKFLETNNVDYKLISYDQLVFSIEQTGASIAQYVGMEKDSQQWVDGLAKVDMHSIFGNRMKDNHKKRRSVSYDSRWLTTYTVNLLCVLFWPVWRLNTKLHGRENTP